MKIMEGSIGSNDCNITMTVPPKKKKLVQARLPFQMLGPSATPNTLSHKKRKNMPMSPTDCRSPKIVKMTTTITKENAEDDKVSDSSIDDNKSKNSELEETIEKPIITLEDSPEKKTNELLKDEEPASEKKTEVKDQTKSGDITRFLQKPSATIVTKDSPFVLLKRCDDDADPAISTATNLETEDKNVLMESGESSSSELAKELESSETEDCNTSKKMLDPSSDVHDENSDSDSERGIESSSDDEDDANNSDEQKINNKGDKKPGEGSDKTPTRSVRSEDTSSARKRLTPKQLEKKKETTKRREERRAERMEKEMRRVAEKKIRQKEKEEKRREKKEKEEAEKEQKRKEREQKEAKKQQEIEQKLKEKERRDKAKEEDRKKRDEAKEEEKRKKEEEKLEAERKMLKAASTFVSFFVPKKLETRASSEDEKLVRTSNFMPFEVKADMRIAPICRRILSDSDKTKFDAICIDKLNGKDQLFVTEIKDSQREKRKSGKTWPYESKDDVVVIEDDDVGNCSMIDQSNVTTEKQRAKLLAFVENRRPPYWGTWRKRSKIVTPRRPFSKDTNYFDYEIESDEEWEEEEPGESIRGSDDEKDEENAEDDEYDVDNDFLVPHGYLSEEEAQADEDEEDMSPETQKFKLKILGEEFEAERKTQTIKIKPKVIGCIWQGPANSYPENIPQKLVDFLMARQAWVRETPIILEPSSTAEGTSASENASRNQASTNDEKRGAKKRRLPEEALPELIRLIHGNIHGLGFLVREFMTFWNRKKNDNANPLAKSSVIQKIRELARRMACPEEGPMHLKACWYVSEETRKSYLSDEIITLPNSWKYALTPKRKTMTDPGKILEKPEKEDKERDKRNVPLITQFTKKITQEEMKKQLTMKTTLSPRASTLETKPPKRAQLISVARGEQFPKSSIINAFTKATINPKHSTTENVNINVSSKESIASDKTKKDENFTPMVIDLESSTECLD